MRGRRVVIIGANGQLGSDLVETLCDWTLVPLTHNDIEICDHAQTRKVLEAIRPDFVINTAAFVRVDDCEDQVKKAFAINAFAARNLAQICADLDSTLVHISTDYVFDGKKREPYTEDDIPNPINVYGNSKLSGEHFVRAICPKHLIIRTSGLYGKAGSSGKGGNFVETMIRLAQAGKPIRVVDDQCLSPTSTRSLASAMPQLLSSGARGLYHITNEGECSWFEFATRIFVSSGLEPVLLSVSSKESGARASRPAYSVLGTSRLSAIGAAVLAPWDRALDDYLLSTRRSQREGRCGARIKIKSLCWRQTDMPRCRAVTRPSGGLAPLQQMVTTSVPTVMDEPAILPPVSTASVPPSVEAVTAGLRDTAAAEPRPTLLLVSYYCPSRAHAGGLRVLDLYALIKRQAPGVSLHLYTHHRPAIDWSTDEARRIFDRIYWSPSERLTSSGLADLSGALPLFDVIDFQFHGSALDIGGFRKYGKRILFTPMESLVRVLLVQLRSTTPSGGRARLHELARGLRVAAQEILFSFKADEVVCVSEPDAAVLRAVTCLRRIRSLETGVSEIEFDDGVVNRLTIRDAATKARKVLYVAYFGSRTNVDALQWYLEQVHPLVRARVPGYRLEVVGRGDLSALAHHSSNSVDLIGEVPRIAPYIESSRVGIAPALSGAGVRGKVNQYAIFGVPSVVSPIAVKGLAYRSGVDVFIAGDSTAFADHCVDLLLNDDLNRRIGQQARTTCLAHYTWDSKWPTVAKIYGLEQPT